MLERTVQGEALPACISSAGRIKSPRRSFLEANNLSRIVVVVYSAMASDTSAAEAQTATAPPGAVSRNPLPRQRLFV